MKTLDEVIKVFTKCFDNTYNIVPLECEPEYGENALQYLKWYKDLADDSEAFADWKENPPLSWSELQHMDGKPVWATFDNENGTWYIAKVYDDEVVLYEWGQEFGERISGAWDYTPKRWQAYRKERN